MFYDPLKQNGIKLYQIIGNHDVYYKNTNEINVPELSLGEYDNVSLIAKNATTIEIENHKICFVPWINSENYQQVFGELKKTDALICCGHFEIEGFAMYRGAISTEGLSQTTFRKFDMTFSGHYHYKSNSSGIYYLGNPYPLTWQDHGDERGFHILDLETRELEFIRNPYEMFIKFIYDDVDKEFSDIVNHDLSKIKGKYVKIVVVAKTNPYAFDTFVNKVYEENPADVSIVEDISEASDFTEEQLDQTQDTVTILNNYVDNLQDSSIEADMLKSFLREVYIEALNITQD